MTKQFQNKLNERALENIAGGQTYWYTRITGTWHDPATGRMFEDGYLVRGKDIETGEKTSSFWLSAEEWPRWMKTMKFRGHVFFKGDSNPNNVDGLPASTTEA